MQKQLHELSPTRKNAACKSITPHQSGGAGVDRASSTAKPASPMKMILEQTKAFFKGKMKVLDAMSNAKEAQKKNSNAQKDKKEGQSKETENLVEKDDEKTYEVEKINSARKNGGKWEYAVKWIGFDGISWIPYGNLVGALCRESSRFLFVLPLFQC